ncbi:ATPase [Devosia sp. LC5]|uniref:helicase HerA-like domain-containing protein n=1 Tax=Devosia sp. LC5 TaxID=1502724 RepID=UPI0004E43E23|nr:helicase HerA-like domain-containing protein [Devosia sp. LC5]KFC71376.1 ATPase [Devosia sp. LC5]
MLLDDKIYLGQSTHPEYLALKYGNRHGLVTGATGTGKTVTLQVMAEGFSAAGVPVFAADIKGDLSGVGKMGKAQGWQTERAELIGFTDFKDDIFPVIFWDLFGRQGHPIRATISEMGALLLSRMLELNDTQEGVLNIAFKVADDEGLLLLDLKDLRALLVDLQERAKEISTRYGNVSTASIGAIQRSLLVLEQQGAENFFGERALDIADLMRTDRDGKGFISILAADELMRAPRLYATFLLWMLSELFEELPEVGDPDKPKLVFFFDEAHLLFDDAPKVLVDKVEQVVRLVRSKGVGVYFVTQNPVDIPETVLAQLSNRVQHALRAYTPREQKAVRVAADTFRPNPDFSTAEVITQLGIGEALVSVLEAKGVPSMVGRTLIRPPSAQVGPLLPEERRAIIANSPVAGLYDTVIDRDSAFEVLAAKARDKQLAEERQQAEDERAKVERTYQEPRTRRATTRQTPAEAAMNSLARTVANRLGNALVRGILGGLKRGR